ncbi:transcription factor [Candidatus Bathyarchaeota archaeon]|nr:transcription factor [Candidatus Bathyarchaeota archaeon]
MAVLDEELAKVARLFGGEDAVTVINILKKKSEATDEMLANESTVRLNTVRKILYKFYDHGLVSCTRVRDEKTSWFIFYWKLQTDQLDAFIRSRKRRVLEKLRQKLDYERDHSFFVCKKCGDVRVTFEEAMESSFRCSKCGGQLESTDNTPVVEFLDRRIKQIEDELKQ